MVFFFFIIFILFFNSIIRSRKTRFWGHILFRFVCVKRKTPFYAKTNIKITKLMNKVFFFFLLEKERDKMAPNNIFCVILLYNKRTPLAITGGVSSPQAEIQQQ